jgi:hypothetical protein
MERHKGNPLIGSSIKTPSESRENANLSNGFHNDIGPKRTAHKNQKEKPAHRLMIYLAAQGLDIVDIAERVNKTTMCVSTVLRQPWARAKIIAIQKENGEEDIRAILKNAAIPALKRVIAIAQGTVEQGIEPQVALAASRDIVDRFLGKATQPLTTEVKKSDELTDAELAARIQEAEQAVVAKTN